MKTNKNKSNFNYLIEQIDYNSLLEQEQKQKQIKLNFNHPVKEIDYLWYNTVVSQFDIISTG